MRHAIIVISDGEDNQSEVSRAQAIEMAERADVTFLPFDPTTAA